MAVLAVLAVSVGGSGGSLAVLAVPGGSSVVLVVRWLFLAACGAAVWHLIAFTVYFDFGGSGGSGGSLPVLGGSHVALAVRERKFDLRFGIRRTHEILEARNSPKTGKCFFLCVVRTGMHVLP